MTSVVISRNGPVISQLSHNVSGPDTVDVQVPTWIETKVGADLPNYKQIIKRKQDATNSYDRYSAFVDYEPALAGYRCLAYPYVKPVWWDGAEEYFSGVPQWIGFTVPYASLPTSAGALALARHNSKFEEVYAPFKGLTFLGELRETLQMVKGRSKTLFDLFLDYKSKARAIGKSFSSPRKAMKKVSNLYLEYTYGWAPLANDISDALSALKSRPSKLIRINGSADADQLLYSTSYVVAFGGQGLGRCRVSYRDLVKGSCLYSSLLDVSLLDPSNAAGTVDGARFGFTIREFVPTAWELLPYSFLADYFVNIGAIIQGCFLETKAFRYSFMNTRAHQTREWVFSPEAPASSTWMYGSATKGSKGGFVHAFARRFRREKVSSFVPPLTYSLPGLGSTKYLNMAALLTNRGLR